MESGTDRLSIRTEADSRPLEVTLKRIERSTDNLNRKLEKGFRFLDARIANFRTELAELEGQVEKTGTIFTDSLEALGGFSILFPLTLLGEQIKDQTVEANKLKVELDRLSDLKLQNLFKEFADLESRIDSLKSAAEEGLTRGDITLDIDSSRTKQRLIANEVKKRIGNLENKIDSEITPNGQIMSTKSMEDLLKKLAELRDVLEQIKNATDDLNLRDHIIGTPDFLNLPQRQQGNLEQLAPRDALLASSESEISKFNSFAEAQSNALDTVTHKSGEARNSLRNLDGAARDLGFTFASSFEDAVVEGRNLSDVLQGLEQDILRILTRKLVTEPLAGAVTGLIGSGLGVLSGEFHGGGRVGPPSVSDRVVPASIFAGAPRFAGGGMAGRVPGLGPGEVPAILHRGEIVRTPSQEAALRRNRDGSGETRIVVNIQTPNPRAFNESRGQIQAMLADAVMAGRRNR